VRTPTTYQEALERIDDLEFELKELRQQYQDNDDATAVAELTTRLGIGRMHAKLLRILADRPDVVKTLDYVMSRLYDDRSVAAEPHIVATMLCQINARVGARVARTFRNVGYAITPEGLKLAEKARAS
jgi:hypothetical protein